MNVDEDCLGLDPTLTEKLKRAIRKQISNADPNEKDDLQQELCIKIFEKTRDIDFEDNSPSFWGFFE